MIILFKIYIAAALITIALNIVAYTVVDWLNDMM